MDLDSKPIEAVHRVDLYIPSQCICASELPADLRNKVIEEVKAQFDGWFGNHSEAEIKGDWRLPDGTIAKEEVTDIYSFCSAEALEEHQEDVNNLAVQIANQLTQERVLRVFDNLKAALYPNTLLPPPVPKKTCACTGKAHGIPGIRPEPVGPKRADRISRMLIIQGILRSFSSAEHGRKLFCDVLNYDYASGEWPVTKWPDSIRNLLTNPPALLAHHNGFKILYGQLSSDSLLRSAERQIIQRLFKDDPTFRGLLIFSDRSEKQWELVNIKTREHDSRHMVLRRMKIGMEAVRTATERLATLEIGEVEESSIAAEEIQARHEKAFDVETVTKAFFIDIANWYFWALKHARFPKDAPKEKDGRDHVSVIRLITRLIFCWFMKQKNLLPDDLFNERRLAELLIGFAPRNMSDNHSVFYKAILQNLFFATLNTEMNKRAWRRDEQNFMAHSLYRHRVLFIHPDKALALFRNIPFLNGGLFECLDKIMGAKDEPIYVRIDGFSDRTDSQPTVPDFLFFGGEQELDLSQEYGDKKFKKVKVRGLIHTLNHYHFTVEESTPLEEEVALDPELAGKIFENLLAAYNPETGTTARKQTGSFYTPREIVNYMVDEALIAYLKGKLEHEFPEASEIEGRLRNLFSYDEEGHLFTETEVEALVRSIDQLKVLDPAVGSGAFPMGILHKLVFVLGRLDPRNERWKERQRQRLQDAISAAERIEEGTIREHTLNELEQQIASLEDAFEKNTLDYGRKLYLIENSLYGVDIQPIAVQIAKMRFFISLIADQKVDTSAENLGVRPLPNLETKLVAANTLIGIEKPEQMVFRSPRIGELEAELGRVRERHFLAKTTTTKNKCRDQDRKLRTEIAELLEKDGWRKPVAKQLAAWDPYDQNASSGFFDPEWMFGLEHGFDITIGNPPYIRADEQSEWNRNQRERILTSKQYETLWEKWDFYIPFIERSYKLLRPNGVSTHIVSDAFCHSKYAQKPQEWFLKHARILRLDFCADVKIFDAAVHNVIYFFQKANGLCWKPERRVHQGSFGNVMMLQSGDQKDMTHRVFFPEEITGKNLNCKTVTLDTICYISYGLRPNSDEKEAKGEFTTSDVVTPTRDSIHCKPYVEGKHLGPWLPVTNLWIEWGTNRAPSRFCRPTFPELYKVPEKILAQRSPGPDPVICLDKNCLVFTPASVGFVIWHELSGIRNKSLKKAARYRGENPPRPDLPKREELEAISRRFSAKYLLGVMNSSAARDFLRANRRSNIHLYPDDWKKLPIPDVPQFKQQPIVELVDRILEAKKNDPSAEISQMEHQIDLMVSQLYSMDIQENNTVEEGPSHASARHHRQPGAKAG